MVAVFVDGQAGTTGLQLMDRLAQRNDIELLQLEPAQRKEREVRQALLNQADVVFLCLPDAAAQEAVALITNPRTCVIDASPAFRTAPGWIYGLPEHNSTQRTQIRVGGKQSSALCPSASAVEAKPRGVAPSTSTGGTGRGIPGPWRGVART